MGRNSSLTTPAVTKRSTVGNELHKTATIELLSLIKSYSTVSQIKNKGKRQIAQRKESWLKRNPNSILHDSKNRCWNKPRQFATNCTHRLSVSCSRKPAAFSNSCFSSQFINNHKTNADRRRDPSNFTYHNSVIIPVSSSQLYAYVTGIQTIGKNVSPPEQITSKRLHKGK